jgi:predicted hotdog family 3-hydroxylacyl-ACP dehydratase
MSWPDIRTLVPHSGPMVLLDQVLSADETHLCAAVTIRHDSLFCGPGGVGAWVGIEYMAQAVAAQAGYVAQQRGEPVKIGFLLGARRFECKQPAFAPGSVLQICAEQVLSGDNGLASFACTISEQQEIIASATVTVFQPDNANEFLQENI